MKWVEIRLERGLEVERHGRPATSTSMTKQEQKLCDRGTLSFFSYQGR